MRTYIDFIHYNKLPRAIEDVISFFENQKKLAYEKGYDNIELEKTDDHGGTFSSGFIGWTLLGSRIKTK